MNVLSSLSSRMHRILRSFPRLTAIGLLGVTVSLLGTAACKKLPLLAPTGTVINLTVASDTAAINSSINIVAVLIENGQQSSGTSTTATTSSTTGAGTPVQDGTVVSFTSSIGTIEPSEAKTTNGKVQVVLNTGTTSGTATITAYSGGAKSTAQIKIGTANAKTVTVTATPQNLTSSGGTAVVSARVDDANGNGVAGAPVEFSTTKGSVSPTTATTNASGVATTTLTTTSAADITASVNGITGKVSVGVSAKATISVSGPTSTVSVSSPAAFSVVVGSTVSVSNVIINYGDGSSKALGALSGTQSVTHYYSQAGILDVSVSATDPDGVVTTAATQVAITGLSMTVSASPTTITRGASVTYTAVVSPSTASIDHYVWDFGDGTNGTSVGGTISHVYAATVPSGAINVAARAYPLYGDPVTVPLAMTIPATKGAITLTGPSTGVTSQSTATTFTIDAGTTVALTNITLDYGDGTTKSFGTFSGSRTDTKFYSTPTDNGKTYTVKVSGTDPDGNTVSSSISLVVQKLNGTLAVTTAGSSLTPTQLTFTIASGQSAALIDRYFWDFNDAPAPGATWETTSNVSPTHQYTRGVWLAKVTVFPVYGLPFIVTVQVPIN